MQFLNPIWLSALAALSIPLVIHLWNIRPGKTLKVGSISIFAESSAASSRSFKLLDILLLILRCLLLAIVAFLLAAPLWQQKPSISAKGWILIPRNYFDEAYHQYKSRIDSLDKKGYGFHYFDAGFAKGKLTELLKDSLTHKSANDSTNYWLLASQLDKQAPAGVAVEIFSPNQAIHFEGVQPGANHHFNWNTFTSADSVRTWLSDAWITENGGIRVAQGTSKPSAISYQFAEVRNDDNNPVFNIKTEDGYTLVRLKANDSVQTVVDNHITALAIYAGSNEADANYLRAALTAASKFMLKRVEVKVYHQPEAIPANADWLFWLSDAPVKANGAHHVLYYITGKTSTNNSWLVNNGDAEYPQLFKSAIAQKTDEEPVWTDATGHTILGKKQTGSIEYYSFYTRFSPTWSDLVWNDAFPRWLLGLLTPDNQIAAKNDTRSLAQQQITPQFVAPGQASFNQQTDSAPLSRYLWYLLVVLFFAERWLAHQNKSNLSNG